MDDLRVLLADTPFAAEGLALLRSFHRKTLEPGQTYILEGDPADRMAVVAAGTIRAVRRVSDNRELTVFLLHRGDVFGLLPLLDGGPFPFSLLADAASTLYVLDLPSLKTSLESNPGFCLRLLSYVAKRLRACIDQLGMLAKPGAVPRVAAALVGLLPAGAPAGVVVGWPTRHGEVAQKLGIAPESLSRALSRLQEMGIIRRAAGRRFRIEDPARLRAAAERSLPDFDDRQ